MTELQERFAEMADTPAPSSRLTADEVYTRAWRRRHRRLATVALVVLAVVGVTIGVGLDATTSTAPQVADPPKPSLSADDGWPADTRTGAIVSAVSTGAGHFYAVVNSCTVEAAGRRCTAVLVGSDDGGGTWTLRQSDVGSGRVSAPAPGVLRRETEIYHESGPLKMTVQARISTDGGRTWTGVQESAERFAAVPAGGWAECAGATRCTLVAVDPATARLAPLAVQPPLAGMEKLTPMPVSAGLWVVGTDAEGHPAVAVSHDRGATWSVRAFGSGELDLRPDALRAPAAVSADGTVGYVVVGGTEARGVPPATAAERTYSIYGTVDGGATWRRLQPRPALTDLTVVDADSYVAADGTHRVFHEPRQWYVGGGARPGYTLETPDGLQALRPRAMGAGSAVAITAPGVYVAFDTEAIYRSVDGVRWSRVAVELPPR